MKNVLFLSLIILGFVVGGCTRAGDTAASPVAASSPNGTTLQGTVDGGGGKGVLCSGKLVTLDRFEAELFFGSPISQSPPTVDEALLSISEIFLKQTAVEDVIPKAQWLKESRQRVLGEWQKLVGDHLEAIPVGTRLANTTDANPPPLPKDCVLVQIASYDAAGKILYDPEYWAMLEPIDIAALYAHEFYYSQFRKYGAKTSDETRRMVGLALVNKLKPMFEDLWSKPRFLHCFGGLGANSSFEFYVSSSDLLPSVSDVYFRGLQGTYVYTQTHGTMSMTENEFLNGTSAVSFSFASTEDVFGTKWQVAVERNLARTPAPGENEFLIRAYRSQDPILKMTVGHCHEMKQRGPSVP